MKNKKTFATGVPKRGPTHFQKRVADDVRRPGPARFRAGPAS